MNPSLNTYGIKVLVCPSICKTVDWAQEAQRRFLWEEVGEFIVFLQVEELSLARGQRGVAPFFRMLSIQNCPIIANQKRSALKIENNIKRAKVMLTLYPFM
jgi:hypothetical protein